MRDDARATGAVTISRLASSPAPPIARRNVCRRPITLVAAVRAGCISEKSLLGHVRPSARAVLDTARSGLADGCWMWSPSIAVARRAVRSGSRWRRERPRPLDLRFCGAGRKQATELALLLAGVVLCAPLQRSVQTVCDQCPRTCPMHRPVQAAKRKPACHQMSAAVAQPHVGEHSPRTGPLLARPPCRSGAGVFGFALEPSTLPEAIHWWRPACTRAVRDQVRLDRSRLADPPETPPPIASA